VLGLLLLVAASVTDWGAVCDGFADDTAALQTAIREVEGEALRFPSGVCVTGPLRLVEGTHLVGPGTIRLHDLSDGPLLTGENLSRVTIEGMTLDANGEKQSGMFSSVVRLRHVAGFRLRSSTIRNARIHGVWLDDGCRDFTITGNRFQNFTIGSAILLGNTSPEAQVRDGEVSQNTILNVRQANGIFTIGSGAVGEYGTGNIRIHHNFLAGVGDVGIEIGAASEDVNVSNNTLYLLGSSTTGIMVRSARRVSVEGNRVFGTRSSKQPQDGIFVWGHPVANPDPTVAEDVTITDNYVRDCARYGIALHSGRRIQIRGNNVGESGQVDLFVNPNGEPYVSDLLN
jgi:parallel beta-helix repeat protein